LSGSGVVRAVCGRDISTEGTASLSKAFVRAENFIIGSGISSSELSFSEYVRACVSLSAGNGSPRVNCGLAIGGLKFCLEAGRLSDAKWEDPMGVGEAIAIVLSCRVVLGICWLLIVD
tara:strand:- start:76 stop:429 length:354 start_codon:yes stop_codon:yes gene_type:complete